MKKTKELLIEMMQDDEELGLYQEEFKQDNCCTLEGQIKRYLDCKGCDRKPKHQETIEEAAERLSDLQEGTYTVQHKTTYQHGFVDGAKEQAKRMYNEEEVYSIVEQAIKDNSSKKLHFFDGGYSAPIYTNLKDWFEQFSKLKNG